MRDAMFLKNFKFPNRKDLQIGLHNLSQKEFVAFLCSTGIVVVSVVIILSKINDEFLVSVPADGGSITEGIIGTPSLVNPVLAVSDADKELTSLVYSGLMRKMPDGTFAPDLAQSYNVSPDGTEYTFTLRKGAVFQDGTPVSADDVVFTINQIKDSVIKSPSEAQWEGIAVTKVDDSKITFTLGQPFASFMDNTTIGILPSHLWQNLTPSQFQTSNMNTKGIGSGPYMITKVSRTSEGIPQVYTLDKFDKFTLGIPHISEIIVQSYANEKDMVSALKSSSINQAGGISSSYINDFNSDQFNIGTSVLPRMFGLFFNKSQSSVLADNSVRQAINMAIDRDALIQKVLNGYGVAINNPVPRDIENATGLENSNTIKADVEGANAILAKDGWVKGGDGILQKGNTVAVTTGKGKTKKTTYVTKGTPARLSFIITTGNAPELEQSAEIIKEQLETIGIEVNIQAYDQGPLNQLIRARNYQALFFGQIVNHESDLFAFWDSSQKTDPGLNIALYDNPKADTILESAQKILDEDARIKKYDQFIDIFNNDLPAVFIYSPEYIYVTSEYINMPNRPQITIPSDQFSNIYDWYAKSDSVWKIFAR